MNREYHLKFCKVCKNKSFNPNQGIVCGLTQLPADFDESCLDFVEDKELVEEIESRASQTYMESNIASTGKRFLNFLIDMIAIYLFSTLIGVMIGITLAIVSPDSINLIANMSKPVEYLVGFIITMTYYTFFEAVAGRSIGKFFTRTKVVNEDGTTPGADVILIRSLCRFIPFEAFSFLANESGWHDRFSKTRVVNVK